VSQGKTHDAVGLRKRVAELRQTASTAVNPFIREEAAMVVEELEELAAKLDRSGQGQRAP
jgi:hypothetical protein